MTMKTMSKTLAAVAFGLVSALATCPHLYAMILYSYDLDSLVYLSTEVVEAEVIRVENSVIEVKLATVHKGDFQKGETVVVADRWLYHKILENEKSTNRLEVGDQLILFLVRFKEISGIRPPANGILYMPVPSGVKIIQGGHVFGFAQRNNPGPYVSDSPGNLAKGKLPAVEGFREKMEASIRGTEQLRQLVEAKKGTIDTTRLLQLLEERGKQPKGYFGRDHIAELVCVRLAELHDPQLLSGALQVLPIANSYHCNSIIMRGFGDPKGRDYLLAKISDDKEPLEARLRYAMALRSAGAIYRSEFTNITATGWRPVGEADKNNSDYLTRITKVAQASGQQKVLVLSLINCLRYFGISDKIDIELNKDLQKALTVLKEVYDTKPAEEIKFAIEETIVGLDQKAYEKLQSPCGPFISILEPVDPAQYTKPQGRSLLFSSTYNTTLLSPKVALKPSVLLVNQETQQKYLLPTDDVIYGEKRGGGSGTVILPNEIPPGRYRVSYQVTLANGVVSTGHYFVTDLK